MVSSEEAVFQVRVRVRVRAGVRVRARARARLQASRRGHSEYSLSE